MRTIIVALLCLITLALTGCGDSGGVTNNLPTNGGQTFRVQLSKLDTNGVTGILVQALDASGQVVYGPVVLTPAPSQLSLDLPGGSRELQLAFRNAGQTVSVFQQRLTDSDTTVDSPVSLDVTDFIKAIELSPKQATIPAAQTQQYTLTATLVDGTLVNITNLAPPTSSNPAAATVDAAGLATGVATGSTTMGANVFFFSDTANLNVAPLNDFILQSAATTLKVGETLQVNALRTVGGVQSTVNAEVTWNSSNNTVANVSNSGLVTGVTAGPVTISALDPVTNITAGLNLQVSEVAVPGFARIAGNFEDISLTGTNLTIQPGSVPQTPPVTGDNLGDNDDGAAFVRLPFNFTLLGDTFDGVWMSTNGFLTSAGGNGIVNQWQPNLLPNVSSQQPHNLIAVFYTDLSLDFQADQTDFTPVRPRLDAGELGTLRTEVRGTAPNRRVIFQWEVRPWDAVNTFNSPTTGYSFQAKLFEGSNQMEFHYREVTATFNSGYGPSQSLIGVMNNAGTQALTWVIFNPVANRVTDGDALRYTP